MNKGGVGLFFIVHIHLKTEHFLFFVVFLFIFL